MRFVYETTEVVRLTVSARGSKEVDPVIAPAPRAGEVGDRHQLDGGDPELGEVREPLGDTLKGTLRRERAHVQFVENQVLCRNTAPGLVCPREGTRIDDPRPTMNPLRLKPRGRVEELADIIEPVTVKVAGFGLGDQRGPGPVVLPLERGSSGSSALRIYCDYDAARRGSPDPEADPASF